MQAMPISTILFVCTGNTCRSPLAEGLANKWFDDHGYTEWIAVSAGTHAYEGMPTSEETIHALSDRGIAFEGKSKPLTKEMAQNATAVFCMSKSHVATAEQYTDNAKFLDPNGEISDPIGQNQLAYDTLANHLEELIASTLETLTKEGV
jgi:protein-tyrosine-phosphatase